jgi:hypothetical protein
MDMSKILADAERTGATHFEILPNLGELLVTLPMKPAQQFTVTAAKLDELFHTLGVLRSGMIPFHSETWERGSEVTSLRDPTWSLENDQLAGDPLLHLRSEWFGWLHFILDKEEARKLGEALIALSNATAPPAAGSA